MWKGITCTVKSGGGGDISGTDRSVCGGITFSRESGDDPFDKDGLRLCRASTAAYDDPITLARALHFSATSVSHVCFFAIWAKYASVSGGAFASSITTSLLEAFDGCSRLVSLAIVEAMESHFGGVCARQRILLTTHTRRIQAPKQKAVLANRRSKPSHTHILSLSWCLVPTYRQMRQDGIERETVLQKGSPQDSLSIWPCIRLSGSSAVDAPSTVTLGATASVRRNRR